MTMIANIDDLRAQIAGALEVEPEEVADEAHFTEELDFDSLMLLEVATRVEKKYGIPVDDVLVSGAQSLAELHAFVVSKTADESAA
ncbi:acyl carrier protein [Streptomyces sp. NBC_01728]|uniref:acyl carrier protein n=2 Tax=Streptomyces TaxID=1883 RepID=UPI002257B2BF|nr:MULTISPECIES: acyl carrier protein [unclassified Streptomyces]MCX4458632.1 acyl carrier protein [Streptomyces sp. NBC_01719]MCX4460477.1 acyl carrier protein [Streptomyces sp. NBC_01719]MCX4497989.1 acyl carrier protein [Streptomyces sp. NBC_01728]MCX4500193.1 acyl carrier protein [Streptomyces sp. NBC_01728]